jgi:hypothetical protein
MLNRVPRFLLVWLALGFAATRAFAASFPPVSGELAGDLVSLVPGAPKLHWRATIEAPREGFRAGTATIDGPGAKMKLAVRLNENRNDGTWRLESGELEPSLWISALAPKFAPSLVGAVMRGMVRLSGEGVFRDGQPAGRVKLEWMNGAVQNLAQKWRFEGITLQGEFVFDAAAKTWASTSPLALMVKTISTERFGARNLLINGLIDERLIFTGQMARVEMAGGEVVIDPFTLPLSPLVVSVNVHFNRIGLQDVAALVPTGLSEARGRINGEVQIDWSKAAGMHLGAGQINLLSDEPTVVRLAPSPGLLTEHMPERFGLLPAWLGPLARWFAPINPAYADLKAIELGQTELRGQSLSVRLTPEGDGRGRSASLEMVARPEKPGSTVDRVNFRVDVSGPLSALFQLSMDDRTHLKFSR